MCGPTIRLSLSKLHLRFDAPRKKNIHLCSPFLEGNCAAYLPLNIFGALGFWLMDKREDTRRGRKPPKKHGCLVFAIIVGILIWFSVAYADAHDDSVISGALLTFGAIFIVGAIANLTSGYEWRKKNALGCLLPLAAIALICGIALAPKSSRSSHLPDSDYRPSTSHSDYEPKPAANQYGVEQGFSRSAKNLNANAAKGNALLEIFDAQMAAVDSATFPEEKIRAIDALLATCESLLELTRETIAMLEADRKDGYVASAGVSEDEWRHTMSVARGSEKTLMDKMSELKQQRAELKREMATPQTLDGLTEPDTLSANLNKKQTGNL